MIYLAPKGADVLIGSLVRFVRRGPPPGTMSTLNIFCFHPGGYIAGAAIQGIPPRQKEGFESECARTLILWLRLHTHILDSCFLDF